MTSVNRFAVDVHLKRIHFTIIRIEKEKKKKKQEEQEVEMKPFDKQKNILLEEKTIDIIA